jgi:hypothetical protein
MSRPRKPYGANPPGRLFATMVKVLAAEVSDQGRLARGKRYWADDAVIDIVVGHGAVTAEIQGSRPQPYVVTLEASPGTGVPAKRDLWVRCTCPDDAGTGLDACKHAVAALFALSDEIAIEPELVERWRNSRRPVRDSPGATVTQLADEPLPHSGPADAPPPPDQPDLRGADVIELRPRHDPDLDAIAMLLQAPAGAAPPTFPEPSPIEHTGLRSRLLADVLDDALDHLAIRWD